MEIKKETEYNKVTYKLTGRLDTTTAPMLDKECKTLSPLVDTLVIDMQGLEYISSAGLRVILSTEKVMRKQGKMIIRNANESIMQIFEITGFADILNIE